MIFHWLTTTSPARALVERVGNEAGEDAQPVHAYSWQSVRTQPRQMQLLKHVDYTWRKLTNVKDARRSKEGQVDDAWVRANCGTENEDFSSATPDAFEENTSFDLELEDLG